MHVNRSQNTNTHTEKEIELLIFLFILQWAIKRFFLFFSLLFFFVSFSPLTSIIYYSPLVSVCSFYVHILFVHSYCTFNSLSIVYLQGGNFDSCKNNTRTHKYRCRSIDGLFCFGFAQNLSGFYCQARLTYPP